MEATRLDQTGCCAVLAEAACAHGTGLNAGNEAEGRNSALHYACSEGAGGRWCALPRASSPRFMHVHLSNPYFFLRWCSVEKRKSISCRIGVGAVCLSLCCARVVD